MHLKKSFVKWRPFCLNLNVLMDQSDYFTQVLQGHFTDPGAIIWLPQQSYDCPRVSEVTLNYMVKLTETESQQNTIRHNPCA